MVAIDWNSVGKRTVDAGLDRVVLYTYGNPGVPWFGVQSIEEQIDGGSAKPYYVDGVKYLNIATTEEYGATISALQYPEEFEECDGMVSIAKGLTLTQQRRVPFSISYRTLIGSDTVAIGAAGYKIHIVYNALAKPDGRTHVSLHDRPSIESYSWEFTTKPIPYPGVRPIAHLTVDSRNTDDGVMENLESYLYGNEEHDALLLQPGQVVAILKGETVSI